MYYVMLMDTITTFHGVGLENEPFRTHDAAEAAKMALLKKKWKEAEERCVEGGEPHWIDTQEDEFKYVSLLGEESIAARVVIVEIQ